MFVNNVYGKERYEGGRWLLDKNRQIGWKLMKWAFRKWSWWWEGRESERRREGERENMNMNIPAILSLEKTANSSLNPSRLWRC